MSKCSLRNSLTHTQTHVIFVTLPGDSRRLIRVRQVTAGLVARLVMNSTRDGEHTGGELTSRLKTVLFKVQTQSSGRNPSPHPLPSVLCHRARLWGVPPPLRTPLALPCQEGTQKLDRGVKQSIRYSPDFLVSSGGTADDQGSRYEDHVTQICCAQAGGLLSYGTGILAADADASCCCSSPSSRSPGAVVPCPRTHAGTSRPGWEEKGFCRTSRTRWTCSTVGKKGRSGERNYPPPPPKTFRKKEPNLRKVPILSRLYCILGNVVPEQHARVGAVHHPHPLFLHGLHVALTLQLTSQTFPAAVITQKTRSWNISSLFWPPTRISQVSTQHGTVLISQLFLWFPLLGIKPHL